MRNAKWIAAALLLAAVFALALPGSAEDAALYTFRNGVSFGMSEAEVKQALSESAQLDEDGWRTSEEHERKSMSRMIEGETGGYYGALTYTFVQDWLTVATYEFRAGWGFDAQKASGTYETVINDLEAAYGEWERPAPGELVRLMNAILPTDLYGTYEDADFADARVWRLESGTLYQFCDAGADMESRGFTVICTALAGLNSTEKETVRFGSYEQDGDKSNGPEPIEWFVLEEDGGSALLISRYILDAPVYHGSRTDVTWETSDLRAWLNGPFLNTAFTPEEQEGILLSDVDNSRSQCCERWETTGGNDTRDAVFVLSYAEACGAGHAYFVDDVDRMSAPTDYALRRGASTQDNFHSGDHQADGRPAGSWWLRSPATYQSDALIISNDGHWSGMYVNCDHLGVRPVIRIDPGSDSFRFENGR